MSKNTALRSYSTSGSTATSQAWQVDAACGLPLVPVLARTLLLFELEVQQPVIDLRRASRVVLNDVGATLQILRLAGSEYGDLDGPWRIEDCIADLSIRRCQEVLCIPGANLDSRRDSIAELWSHSAAIGHFSRRIAEDMTGVTPDQAYLVGLLHAIGSLPQALGWYWMTSGPAQDAFTADYFARQWSLPFFIQDALCKTRAARCTANWAELLHAAHLMAADSHFRCSRERGTVLPFRTAPAADFPMPAIPVAMGEGLHL